MSSSSGLPVEGEARDDRPRSVRKRVVLATRMIRLILRIGAMLRFFVRVKVTNRSSVPPTGPVLVVANHPSEVDPILVLGALRRDVAFLAKDELFRVPVLGKILGWLGHISVKRGTAAARMSADEGVSVLEVGGLVVVFYEGGCSPNGIMKSLQKMGFMHMAAKTGAVVVPLGIKGTNTVKDPNGKAIHLARRVELNFGAPMTHQLTAQSPSAELRVFGQSVVAEIAQLADQPAPLPA